ncbi:MAG: metal ABC transporter substrate-binding protein [Clostridium sp.]|nr:metal ABC transporter substrate-binding protein [Clostridium sp.]
MKKLVCVFLILCICVTMCGCNDRHTFNNGKITVVCTSFSAYDWVRELAKDELSHINLRYLGEKGVDMHSYQPSAEDMAVIKSCDLLIYVGGESEDWVEDALEDDGNPDMLVVKMLDVVGENALVEEELPGVSDKEHEHEQDGEYDEHIWLSPKRAALIVAEIEGCLETLDGGSASYYRENYNGYMETLSALDKDYAKAVEAVADKTILFGDRFPFRYMTEDYGLEYYAAFDGCSAETEASFETITFLAGRLDELNLKHIIVIEGSDRRLANTINESTKDRDKIIVELDSIQSVSADDIEKGYTYIGAMEKNLQVLETVLY